jgi:hypothetical protein
MYSTLVIAPVPVKHVHRGDVEAYAVSSLEVLRRSDIKLKYSAITIDSAAAVALGDARGRPSPTVGSG